MFETLEKRYEFVHLLGDYVTSRFSEPYNIFVFGSFLTDDFVQDKSDIDLGIYTEKKISDLDDIIEEFLSNYNLDHDTIWIQPEFSTNYIDIAALSGYRLTDYYPDVLSSHLGILESTYQPPTFRSELKELENYARTNVEILSKAAEFGFEIICHGGSQGLRWYVDKYNYLLEKAAVSDVNLIKVNYNPAYLDGMPKEFMLVVNKNPTMLLDAYNKLQHAIEKKGLLDKRVYNKE